MTQDCIEQVGTTILSERHCHLGEGCTYDSATNTAWWFDILERTLFQADLAKAMVTSHTLPLMASVLAFIDDQRQLLATARTMAELASAYRTRSAFRPMAQRPISPKAVKVSFIALRSTRRMPCRLEIPRHSMTIAAGSVPSTAPSSIVTD
jgi:hypothetical protein